MQRIRVSQDVQVSTGTGQYVSQNGYIEVEDRDIADALNALRVIGVLIDDAPLPVEVVIPTEEDADGS